jgi:agmatine/peptidylarginine deiminase
MTRIELTDTTIDVITKMSGGNPGALTVCMEILEHGAAIDPDAAMGGLGALLSLDTCGIYEHRIWMLYKDACGENLSKMLAIERACQLGFITRDELNHAIDNRGNGIDVDDLVLQVKERLPAFVIVPDENLIKA